MIKEVMTTEQTTTEIPDSMNAIVQDAYGSADMLKLEQVDGPTIGEDEVLVRVRAAGVDRGVWHMMTGRPYLMRVIGFGFSRPKARVRGLDVAGIVVAVGSKVTRLAVGDEVFGAKESEGTYAEYVAINEDALVKKPADMSFEQAGAMTISGLTAQQAVYKVADVQAEQKVMVLGAGGGVGSFAVQMAKAAGAEVTGVTSTPKMEAVRAMGADHVIDYTKEKITDAGIKYDVILDIGGNRPVSLMRRVLTKKGTLVIIGGERGGNWFGGIHRQLWASMLSMFVGQKLKTFVSMTKQDELQALRKRFEEGSFKPVIDKTYPLSETADAIRYMEQGGSTGGKIVITIE
jgi:NADPH:quinone reductase-like Zn-dependent oxidoreductase